MSITQRVEQLGKLAVGVAATFAAAGVVVPYMGLSYMMINLIHLGRKFRDGTL